MTGVELGTIRDLLGHTTTRMTERYAHITPGHLHDAVQRISRTSTTTGTSDRVDDEPLRAVASNRPTGREKSECPRRDSNPRYRRERPKGIAVRTHAYARKCLTWRGSRPGAFRWLALPFTAFSVFQQHQNSH